MPGTSNAFAARSIDVSSDCVVGVAASGLANEEHRTSIIAERTVWLHRVLTPGLPANQLQQFASTRRRAMLERIFHAPIVHSGATKTAMKTHVNVP